MNLPHGAREIWDMRLQRQRPNETVFVSLIGPLSMGYFQVLIDGRDRIEQLDFRWSVDLSVCLVFSSSKVAANRVSALAKIIVRNAPNGGYTTFDRNFGHLWLWDVDKQDGFLVSWWGGYLGIPEIGIETQPEEFKFTPMTKIDRGVFKGVVAA